MNTRRFPKNHHFNRFNASVRMIRMDGVYIYICIDRRSRNTRRKKEEEGGEESSEMLIH